ncbi:MAG: hypothetical protein HRT86_08015 [Ilumatobacteraceae bacterium]|nr:hypothetical protein [Ilumatobacteraceae bacterium]
MLRGRTWGAAAIALGLVAGTACSTDDGDADGDVTPAEAYVAIIEWEVSQQEPTVDESGEVELAVVFVAAAGGGTIDIGVQAAVVEQMIDTATIRFADDPADAIDDGIPDEPVRNDGVLLVVADIPPPAPTIEVTTARATSADNSITWGLTIEADDTGAAVVNAEER